MDLRDRLGHPLREVLGQPKRFALLVYLAVEGRRGPIPRDRLLAMFWPESDAPHARNTLSQALHHLRQSLGADVISSQGATTIELCGDRLWCDAGEFLTALEHGEPELALDLYRGEFCPSLFVAGAPEAESWLEETRRRMSAQALAAARTQAERLAARGDASGAARAARRALGMRPDDEADVRALLGVLDQAGDTAGALLAYQDYERRLAAELETEPDPETTRLVETMRRRREQAVVAASATGESAAAPPAEPRIGAATPVPGSALSSPWSALRRFRIAAGVAGAMLLLAGGLGALALTRRATRNAAPPVKTLMVFPFTVRGSAGLEYLHEGMVDLLSAKLDGTAGFRAIDPRSVIAATGRTTSGAVDYPTLAGRLGAGWYVTGDVVEIAGRIQVSGALFDPAAGPNAIASATVSGDTTHLFEMVDNLTGRILARLLPGRDTALTRLAALTTTSLPALKAFLEGEQAMRAGRDAQAGEAFREAASLDTAFALAEYRLAVSSTWILVPTMGRYADIAAMAQRAERHANRLSPLVRDLLTAYHAYKVLRIDESELMYRRIADAHPDNVEARFMLGESHFHLNAMRGRSPAESRADFQRVLELDPGNAHALLHLARLAALEGRVAELDSFATAYSSRFRDAERTLELRALQAAMRDDRTAYHALLREAAATDPLLLESVFQGTLYWAQNDFAVPELAEIISRAPTAFSLRVVLQRLMASVSLAQGRWSRPAGPSADTLTSRQWLEHAALLSATPDLPLRRATMAALRDSVNAQTPFAPVTRVGQPMTESPGPEWQAFLSGLLSIRLADTAAVRRSLSVLAAAPSGPRSEIGAWLARVLGATEAQQRGDLRAALEEMHGFPEVLAGQQALPGWGNYERFFMAELLHGLGRDDEALVWYESYPDGYDLPWMPLAHLRQGQIYERRGNAERARFHYGRFVRFYDNADPDLQPMVARARAALAQLGGAPETH